jgi:hypothetical protein
MASRRRRRYRHFFVVAAIAGGVVLGVTAGGFAALAGDWRVLLLVVLIPVAARLYALMTGKPWSLDPAVWLYPAVALPVGGLTYALVPAETPWVGIALAAGLWFLFLFVVGVLEVVFDPDGTIAESNGREGPLR